MVRQLLHLKGHEFEQTPGDTEGQGSLACCSPWGRQESDTTERLNDNYHTGPMIQRIFGAHGGLSCVYSLWRSHVQPTEKKVVGKTWLVLFCHLRGSIKPHHSGLSHVAGPHTGNLQPDERHDLNSLYLVGCQQELFFLGSKSLPTATFRAALPGDLSTAG